MTHDGGMRGEGPSPPHDRRHFAASGLSGERHAAECDCLGMLDAHAEMRAQVAPSASPAEPAEGDALALVVHARLCRVYKCPIAYFSNRDPLSELVSAILSHRTRNAASSVAFKALRARFPTWEEVMAADIAEIETAIAGVTWPEMKAPRIRALLAGIDARVGRLSLDFLADLAPEEARAWLETFPGIGPKTSAAVLSFSTLRMRALPVDSHHHRVARRLGLIGPRVGLAPAHVLLLAQLPARWTAQDLYDNHEILMLHGQDVCHHNRPACGRCVLVDLCPSAVGAVREP